MSKLTNKKAADPAKDPPESIRAWLYATIEIELQKDEAEIDCELIRECSELDAYLTGSDSPITEKEYLCALQKIQAKAAEKQAQSCGAQVISHKRDRFKAIRVALIAAVITVVMLSTVAVAAISQGLIPAEFMYRIHLYTTVEEAAETLKLDILYPTAMPEGVALEKIVLSAIGPNVYEIIFITDKPTEYRISTKNEILTDPATWQNTTRHEINGVNFYVLPLSDNELLAVGQQNGFEYQITATNMEDLLVILNGMRKLK